ncbi:MAG: extracellular solute-binding protein [Planctomycetota bacterium]
MTHVGFAKRIRLAIAALLLSTATFIGCSEPSDLPEVDSREEVVFWHFWGGRDRPIVDEIVRRFNDSQDRYRVRALAFPGANLDLKFFLSVAGGDPPDVLNHDDPVVADWAQRGIITPLDELIETAEYQRLRDWLFPAARQLGTYNERLYALCNGLDIRALYCNATMLDEHGLALPRTIADLDQIASTIAPADGTSGRRRMGYLPDPRRLWAWGIVFGGEFANFNAKLAEQVITADSPAIQRALEWMAGYSKRYGPSEVTAFRSGEQALTGSTFPLLADRRYAVMMDGQWRVRDIAEAEAAAQERGITSDRYAVVPLPAPPAGRTDAGWVNGNFFVVPQRARRKAGAIAFMKFWVGFSDSPNSAAEACSAGGWIPVSQAVVDQPSFQQALVDRPLLTEFVRLAASPHQIPVPALPVASTYYQQVVSAAQAVMYRGDVPGEALKRAAKQTRARLREVLGEY